MLSLHEVCKKIDKFNLQVKSNQQDAIKYTQDFERLKHYIKTMSNQNTIWLLK